MRLWFAGTVTICRVVTVFEERASFLPQGGSALNHLDLSPTNQQKGEFDKNRKVVRYLSGKKMDFGRFGIGLEMKNPLI